MALEGELPAEVPVASACNSYPLSIAIAPTGQVKCSLELEVSRRRSGWVHKVSDSFNGLHRQWRHETNSNRLSYKHRPVTSH